ncbi:lipid kinase [soil metagenome]
MDRALAIRNSDAGSADSAHLGDALDSLRGVFNLDVEATSGPEELDAVLADAEHVIVCGGDGSLHAVVNALGRIGRLDAVTLGLLPLGTGNDFARGLDLPLDPVEAAAVIVEGHTVPIDLIEDDHGKLIINAVHLGIGAEAAAAAAPWKKRLGPLGYVVGALISTTKDPSFDLQVLIDDEPLPAGNGLLQVAINNGPFVGGGTPLSPDANPSDGQLDVAVSYATQLSRRFTYARLLRRGEHVNMDEVLVRHAHTVTVTGEAFRSSADGEVEDPETARSWTLMPGALKMYVPAVGFP